MFVFDFPASKFPLAIILFTTFFTTGFMQAWLPFIGEESNIDTWPEVVVYSRTKRKRLPFCRYNALRFFDFFHSTKNPHAWLIMPNLVIRRIFVRFCCKVMKIWNSELKLFPTKCLHQATRENMAPQTCQFLQRGVYQRATVSPWRTFLARIGMYRLRSHIVKWLWDRFLWNFENLACQVDQQGYCSVYKNIYTNKIHKKNR